MCKVSHSLEFVTSKSIRCFTVATDVLSPSRPAGTFQPVPALLPQTPVVCKVLLGPGFGGVRAFCRGPCVYMQGVVLECWLGPELEGAAWWLPEKTPGQASLAQVGVKASGREFNVHKSTIHIRSASSNICTRASGWVEPWAAAPGTSPGFPPEPCSAFVTRGSR